MQTSLKAIAKKAKENKEYRFRSLSRELTPNLLRECFENMNRKAATGVDEVSHKEYGENFSINCASLIDRLKRNAYHASLVRRKNIPKGNGKTRPLGIPIIEDKLLQSAVKTILEAIYEQDFLSSCFGYRPKIGAREAVDELQRELTMNSYHWVVEADIRGFFDNINHDKLVTMLERRIDDKRFIGLIRKWLRAGVLDTDGKIVHPETGTPQGGVISPMLANIYMHNVLNEWFENVVKKHCKGKAYLCVYADDFVCGFELENDAKKFYDVLSKRLAKFDLEVAPEKTKLIKFSRFGGESNETFEFLGFEFRWVKSKLKDTYFVKRSTAKKRFLRSVKNLGEWCKLNKSRPTTTLIKMLNRKLIGYFNYYGVPGNFDGIEKFACIACARLFKWLNRRSQKTSFTWEGFNNLLRVYPLAKPKIAWRK